jgi:hypothetical protein
VGLINGNGYYDDDGPASSLPPSLFHFSMLV